ncbi:hypothetical protein AVM02_15870 [Brucella anthropi]
MQAVAPLVGLFLPPNNMMVQVMFLPRGHFRQAIPGCGKIFQHAPICQLHICGKSALIWLIRASGNWF